MKYVKPQPGSLVDTVTGEVFEFTYNPASVGVTEGAEYAEMQVQGVHHPRYQYAGGKGRVLNFSLTLYGPHGGRSVREQVNWLRSLAYPDLEIDAVPHRPPHRVILNLGQLYRRLVCVVVDTNHTWQEFTPELEPIKAEVALTLNEFKARAVGYREVRDG